MKLQGLSIIFVIIIVPIVMVLTTYINNMIDVQNKQASYKTALMNATYDAVRAYQMNTLNNSFTSVYKSRERDVKASVNSYFNSLASNLNLSGYSKNELSNYTPAVFFNLYDGFYVYGPYENYASVETNKNTKKTDVVYSTDNSKDTLEYGLKPFTYYSCEYASDKQGYDLIINYTLDNYISVSGTYDHGKQYVTSSGYYIDYNKVQLGSNCTAYINGKEVVKPEELGEYLITLDANKRATNPMYYRYVNYNNVKYYYDSYITNTDQLNKTQGGEPIPIFKLSQNQKVYITENELQSLVRYRTSEGQIGENEKNFVKNPALSGSIFQDTNAYHYYVNAYNFSQNIEPILKQIDLTNDVQYEANKDKKKNAKDANSLNDELSSCVIKTKAYHESYTLTENKTFSNVGTSTHVKTDYSNKKVFATGNDDVSGTNNPELESSSFNQHRIDVISSIIEYELSSDIANFNKYVTSSYYYQMPTMTENDWYNISNNVSVVSFLQGLVVGNYKYFNDYAVVLNTKQKEFISKDSIYVQENYETNGKGVSVDTKNNNSQAVVQNNYAAYNGQNGQLIYHNPRCQEFNENVTKQFRDTPNTSLEISAYRTIDYEDQDIECKDSEGDTTVHYYMQPGTGAYECVVSSNDDRISTDDLLDVNKSESYPNDNQDEKVKINDVVRYAYIRALAREKGASTHEFTTYILSSNVRNLNGYSLSNAEKINTEIHNNNGQPVGGLENGNGNNSGNSGGNGGNSNPGSNPGTTPTTPENPPTPSDDDDDDKTTSKFDFTAEEKDNGENVEIVVNIDKSAYENMSLDDVDSFTYEIREKITNKLISQDDSATKVKDVNDNIETYTFKKGLNYQTGYVISVYADAPTKNVNPNPVEHEITTQSHPTPNIENEVSKPTDDKPTLTAVQNEDNPKTCTVTAICNQKITDKRDELKEVYVRIIEITKGSNGKTEIEKASWVPMKKDKDGRYVYNFPDCKPDTLYAVQTKIITKFSPGDQYSGGTPSQIAEVLTPSTITPTKSGQIALSANPSFVRTHNTDPEGYVSVKVQLLQTSELPAGYYVQWKLTGTKVNGDDDELQKWGNYQKVNDIKNDSMDIKYLGESTVNEQIQPGYTVVAQLIDGKGQVAQTVTLRVSNIDNTKPSQTKPNVEKSDETSITIKGKQIDYGDWGNPEDGSSNELYKVTKSASGIRNYKYRRSKAMVVSEKDIPSTWNDENNTTDWTEWQDSPTFDDLEKNGSYAFQTIAYDKSYGMNGEGTNYSISEAAIASASESPDYHLTIHNGGSKGNDINVSGVQIDNNGKTTYSAQTATQVCRSGSKVKVTAYVDQNKLNQLESQKNSGQIYNYTVYYEWYVIDSDTQWQTWGSNPPNDKPYIFSSSKGPDFEFTMPSVNYELVFYAVVKIFSHDPEIEIKITPETRYYVQAQTGYTNTKDTVTVNIKNKESNKHAAVYIHRKEDQKGQPIIQKSPSANYTVTDNDTIVEVYYNYDIPGTNGDGINGIVSTANINNIDKADPVITKCEETDIVKDRISIEAKDYNTRGAPSGIWAYYCEPVDWTNKDASSRGQGSVWHKLAHPSSNQSITTDPLKRAFRGTSDSDSRNFSGDYYVYVIDKAGNYSKQTIKVHVKAAIHVSTTTRIYKSSNSQGYEDYPEGNGLTSMYTSDVNSGFRFDYEIANEDGTIVTTGKGDNVLGLDSKEIYEGQTITLFLKYTGVYDNHTYAGQPSYHNTNHDVYGYITGGPYSQFTDLNSSDIAKRDTGINSTSTNNLVVSYTANYKESTNNSKVLYARWTAKAITIAYHSNDLTTGSIEDGTSRNTGDSNVQYVQYTYGINAAGQSITRDQNYNEANRQKINYTTNNGRISYSRYGYTQIGWTQTNESKVYDRKNDYQYDPKYRAYDGYIDSSNSASGQAGWWNYNSFNGLSESQKLANDAALGKYRYSFNWAMPDSWKVDMYNWETENYETLKSNPYAIYGPERSFSGDGGASSGQMNPHVMHLYAYWSVNWWTLNIRVRPGDNAVTSVWYDKDSHARYGETNDVWNRRKVTTPVKIWAAIKNNENYWHNGGSNYRYKVHYWFSYWEGYYPDGGSPYLYSTSNPKYSVREFEANFKMYDHNTYYQAVGRSWLFNEQYTVKFTASAGIRNVTVYTYRNSSPNRQEIDKEDGTDGYEAGYQGTNVVYENGSCGPFWADKGGRTDHNDATIVDTNWYVSPATYTGFGTVSSSQVCKTKTSRIYWWYKYSTYTHYSSIERSDLCQKYQIRQKEGNSWSDWGTTQIWDYGEHGGLHNHPSVASNQEMRWVSDEYWKHYKYFYWNNNDRKYEDSNGVIQTYIGDTGTIKYEYVGELKWEKDKYLGNVSSTASGSYPSNNHQDDYWYVSIPFNLNVNPRTSRP